MTSAHPARDAQGEETSHHATGTPRSQSPLTIDGSTIDVRRVLQLMVPNGADSSSVRAAKHVFRWSVVAAGAAVVTVVVGSPSAAELANLEAP